MSLTPMKAIRQKCLECCCGSAAEVKECQIQDCALHAFRMGKNPNIKLSDEERARRAEKARENMGNLKYNSGGVV